MIKVIQLMFVILALLNMDIAFASTSTSVGSVASQNVEGSKEMAQAIFKDTYKKIEIYRDFNVAMILVVIALIIIAVVIRIYTDKEVLYRKIVSRRYKGFIDDTGHEWDGSEVNSTASTANTVSTTNTANKDTGINIENTDSKKKGKEDTKAEDKEVDDKKIDIVDIKPKQESNNKQLLEVEELDKSELREAVTLDESDKESHSKDKEEAEVETEVEVSDEISNEDSKEDEEHLDADIINYEPKINTDLVDGFTESYDDLEIITDSDKDKQEEIILEDPNEPDDEESFFGLNLQISKQTSKKPLEDIEKKYLDVDIGL